MTTPCIFCSIVAGQAEASVVHRDDLCMAFMDLMPVNPGHLLAVPREHATYLAELPRFAGDGFGLTFGPSYGQPVSRARLDREAAAIAASDETA